MMARVERLRVKLDILNISDYHGLNSPGVTCYLNSVLQVLFMTEGFREAVKGCSSDDSTTIDAHLRRLFSDLEGRVAKTHHITKKLGITNVYEQRDAAEYFEKILCRTSPEAAKMFKGELNHKTTCLSCMDRNDSRGFFWMLPLAVEDLGHQSYSVEKGLKTFFKGEKACGDNKIYCNRCIKKQDADFGCEMTQNPEVLTLLLKRFTFDYKRRCYVKLHCKVDVPQILHMEDCDYDLYALVNHFGNLTGGHYTAHVKSFETQMWYHFNDSIVKGVKLPFGVGGKSLRSSTAYLLMYRKVSRNPEKISQGDQEALCAYSDVDTEGRHEEAERGHALDEDDDAVSKALLDFSGEMEKQPHQTATCVRSQKETLCTGDGCKTRSQTQNSNSAKLQKHGQQTSRQLDTSSKGHMHLTVTRGTPTAAQCVDMSEQNQTPRKKRLKSNVTGTKTSVTNRSLTRNRVKHAEAVEEVGIGGKSEQRRKAGVSPNVYHKDVKSLHISSNGCSYSLLPNMTGRSQSQSNEPLQLKSNLCRKCDFLTADSSCKLDHVQPVTKGEKSARKRNAAKSTDKVKKQPWKY